MGMRVVVCVGVIIRMVRQHADVLVLLLTCILIWHFTLSRSCVYRNSENDGIIVFEVRHTFNNLNCWLWVIGVVGGKRWARTKENWLDD